MPLLRYLHLPMLRKELVERAARRRTYTVRTVYALMFFLAALICYAMVTETWVQTLMHGPNSIRAARPGLNALGSGWRVFSLATWMQLLGVYLFLPAMMCGSITSEKERGSMSLLMLTDLSAFEAVMQKYLSGLIPMLTLLLLIVPVGAIAYLLGGLTIPTVLVMGLIVLAIACSVGAIAMACSSYCRTTVGALILCYLILGTLSWLPGVAIYPLTIDVQSIMPRVRLQGTWSYLNFLKPFLATQGITTLLALSVACVCYYRRAEVPSKAYVRRLFQSADRSFRRINKRFGSVNIVREKESLPTDAPVTWRELERRNLGQFRYKIRMLLPIQCAIAVVVLVALSSGQMPVAHDILRVSNYLVWALAIGYLAVQGANAIVSERVNQALDVLLTTPMSGADIVRQKASALAHLKWLVLIPVMTIPLVNGFLAMKLGSSEPFFITYAVTHLITALIYLPIAYWLGLRVGMSALNRISAIMRVLLLIVLWNLCTFPLVWVAVRMDVPVIATLCPAYAIAFIESGGTVGHPGFFIPFAVLYVGILVVIRTLTLVRSNKTLGP